ncbi:hypothetical protein RhiirA4_517534 [Rhizophagus irregularis]|uniref:MATA-HMG n=1 Tax=Rhizophagus irregularis TaxID=588596 RepID=A0A2I1FWS4_9GLOM|nr:hypothetical protein RhiirA4_517534 [Rhizophagus irregularis]
MSKYKQKRRLNKSPAYKRTKKKYPPDPNKPDEDIIKESIHLLYLDIDKLLINSKKTRRYERLSRKGITEFEKPPRPQNIFILYRRNKSASPEFKSKLKVDKKVKLTSKEIGILWNNETEEVIKFFCALERIAEKKHREIYGDNYKFEKKKSQPKDRKNKNKKGSLISSHSPPIETLPIPLPYDQQYDGQINTSNPNPNPNPSSNPNSNLNFNPNFGNTNEPTIPQIYEGINIPQEYEGTKLANIPQEYKGIELANIPQTYNDFELANIPQAYEEIELTNILQTYNDFELENILQTYNDFELANIPQAYEEIELTNIPQTYNDIELENIPQTYNNFELANIPQTYEEIELANILQINNNFELTNIPQTYNNFELDNNFELENIPQTNTTTHDCL